MDSQFDDLAIAYEESLDSMPFRKHIELNSFLSVVGDVHGLRVLDLGCGSGLYTRELKRRGAAKVTGADISVGMMDYAARREARENLGVDYLVHDAMSSSADENRSLIGQFDLVVSVYVLPYANTEARLASLCMTARKALSSPGQRFVAFTLNPDFCPDAHWYSHYGFSLSQTDNRRRDGAIVHLTAEVGEHAVSVDAFYWSKSAHERALSSAGFDNAQWIKPWLSDEGKELLEPSYWSNYLTSPHAIIIDAMSS
ncbi:class I SAM-dependent methyltransferase [Paraburkholderia susongensis]|uniref:Methyltransferase domain-containing protein n=1 Tax=Paraburkholderia susongensis TaxID=1515439 RepID=A0A1X7HXM2_9BURK|nr:class I SAM-dependent methyltransferase [Paraburkholderia susongensis]SMG06726.1 Methyltransferase domain-containing protein [Paraburkholderia susongensis]